MTMSNLNYFMPYRRAEGHHENPLTRAFLTAMRFSPALLFSFYQMVRDALETKAAARENLERLPRLHELTLSDVQLATQKKHLEQEVEALVSVLITDDREAFDQPIIPVERDAVYDGIISFGHQVTLFVENKLRVGQVWHGQLCPSTSDVRPGTHLMPRAAVLSWRDLIDVINGLIANPAIGGTERMVLEDLRSYINIYHGHLNPYRQFGLCRGNHELLLARIQVVLKDVSAEDRVHYHTGWGYYIAVEGQPGIDRVALILQDAGEGDWKLELFIGFADTVNQARGFFALDVDLNGVDRLRARNWVVSGNFHLSHMQRHLYWYPTDPDRVKDYLLHWKAHPDNIAQWQKDDLPAFLQDLFTRKVIDDNDEMRTAYNRYVQDTNRTRINVGPGFVLRYFWSSKDAMALDAQGRFITELAAKIREGFTFIGTVPGFLNAVH